MNSPRIGTIALFAILLAGFGLQTSFGQTANTGSISGRVTDSSGAIISQAKIMVTSVGKGFTKD